MFFITATAICILYPPQGLTWDRMSEKNLRPVAHRLPDSLQLLGALVTLPPRCSSRRALEITFLKFGKRHFNFLYEIRGEGGQDKGSPREEEAQYIV